MDLILAIPATVVGVLLVFLGSTVAFDVVHVTLHRMAASRVGWVRALGELHEVHHRFMDRDLVVHEELIGANLRHHVIPEFLTQATFSALLLLVLPALVVVPAFALQAVVFLAILRVRGIDVNHRSIAVLSAYRPLFLCLPEYHAWHHTHPDAHFSSWIKLLDHLLGTGSSLVGRRIALCGAATPFGAALQDALAARGHTPGDVFPAAPPAGFRSELPDLDVLILAQVPEPDGADYAQWIEAFCDATKGRKLPPEVWAVDGGAGFLPRARRYFLDRRVVYRHLAPLEGAAPERAARIALDFVRRGFNFAPAGRSPAALAAFLRFRAG
jgi:hypothetical protein